MKRYEDIGWEEVLLAHLNSFLRRLNLVKLLISIYHYYVTYRNFEEVLVHRVLNRFPMEATLRNGRKVTLENPFRAYYYTVYYTKLKNLELNDSFIEFEYNGKRVKFYGLKYGDPWTVFAHGDYDHLDVRDKVVIDIGASIGDTSIYFALRGAKKVIAFEPFPRIFELAKRNIKENGLQDKIVLVNAGCGYDGKVRVRENFEANSSTQLADHGTGLEIPIYSLNTIVKMFDIKDAVLKVDCEGCEYELFRTATDESLSKFDQIMVEYHYGYKELTKRLEKVNFKVKRSLPIPTKGGMILGYIYARRRQ